MGIRHIALFRWIEGVTPEQVERVEALLGRLPGVIPELRGYEFGADLGIGAGNYDFAVVADVEGEPGFLAYQRHPDHQAALAVIKPMLADRAAVQFNID
ncbi:Dabb family protein [Actinorugispora endophytica]|uniref:Stress responsive alpha/beta barrel protein n=1 Tax=Actinorugispora endophytica TaxID=1605990 RepID=A0A4R6V259_9ACTN|nr:Dabb family protein [Actinorugispora endophytica]TDQ52152.1 stress responsive alpha/beta barrel protein [Actinorugispora endophytica]